jgi:hypothetical protein
MSIPKVFVLPLFLASFTTRPALGQQCPQSSTKEPDIPSQVRTLQGQLVYHDGIRKWFELKLDLPQCGQHSVQLVQAADDWEQLEILRGCRVSSKGPIDFSPTGYYSLDLCQTVAHIEPMVRARRSHLSLTVPRPSPTSPSTITASICMSTMRPAIIRFSSV